jgi:hypothetical protein
MNFKRLILLYTILLGAVMNLKAQSSKRLDFNNTSEIEALELTGQLPGLKEGETVILRRLVFDRNPVFIDSAKVINGKFFFRYRVNEAPQIFLVGFSRHESFISIALSNEQVLLTSNVSLDAIKAGNFIDYVTAGGSKTFVDWVYLELAIGRMWAYSNQFIGGLMMKFKDSTLSKEKLKYISGLLKAKESVANAALESFVGPARDLYPLFFRDQTSDIQHSSVWPYIYNQLSTNAKSNEYGKWMADRMILCEKQEAPNFNFVVKDGGENSLNDVIKKNKLTILHFWSNGSIDRVRIHNELEKAYGKYKLKGLEVISVSLDANPEKWKRVIQQDKIPGYQTCDFREEESPIAQLYKMDPKSTVNILIDQNGKIVAWDVDGPALFAYLYTIFGD